MTNVLERKFSEAERALEDVKSKGFSDDEYRAGYLNALEGILLSVRSGDERDFFNKVDFNKSNMKKYVDDFKSLTGNPLRTNWDMGFLSAWTDLLNYRINTGNHSTPK
ncbi:hypothetical protein A3K69_03060 [Candidatus Bathyarchaeota archaeon RBG_16_57_9]|nr:MAG: hypothetical protein A3K69_03060 [Candidatus Bathyarchaeota archaeon RBG_16_57_9]